MPQKWWSHAACGHSARSGNRRCSECGQESTISGSGYSMIEAMEAYQGFYGLKPVGPHRPLADSLLGALVELCTKCDGQGVLGLESGDAWRTCDACHGFGRRLKCSERVFLAARQQILEKFPDAETSRQERF